MARHGHLSVTAARADVRRGCPGAARSQDRLPRGDRVPQGMDLSRCTRSARRRDEELELWRLPASTRVRGARVSLRFAETAIPGAILIEPQVFRDSRGFFLETYQTEKYRAGGIDAVFVQDNHSSS